MEKIAFIIGEQFLYWSPLILAIAVVAALCAFVALHLGTGGKTLGTFLVLPLSLVLGLLLGRLIHWYCRPDAYESLSAAMSDFTGGSYALTGVAAGVLHFALVTCVPVIHGGFLLYNGGFTACLLCIFLLPVLERFAKTKEERAAVREK